MTRASNGPPIASAIASVPPARRSTTQAPPTISSPWARICSTAATVEPPVVTVSSTTNTLVPSSTGPSTIRCSPWALVCLRTKKPTRPSPSGTAIAAQASGIAAITGPPTASAPCADRRRREQLAGGAKAGRPQQRPARVDVVLRRRPARQRHLADDQRMLAQLADQGLAC